MVWQQWFVIAFLIIGALKSVSMVDKPRTYATTANEATMTVVFTIILVAIIISI